VTRYEPDANRLAMQVASLAAAPGAAAMATDTDAVNLARRGLRVWCRQVLTEVSPAQQLPATRKPRLVDLATDPVRTLHILLSHDPAPLRLRPIAGASDVDTVNQRWARLGHHIELATHSWTTADPASRPGGERAWPMVADVAAVAETAAVLDRHLADLHPGRHRIRVLREAGEIGLAAQCVLKIATGGPLPPPQPLDPAPGRLQPVPVPTLSHLPDALTNLGRLTATVPNLRPRTFAALIGLHIPVLEALADALTHDPPPGQRHGRQRFAESLRAHGNALSNIRVAVKPLRSIDGDDRRPTIQAQAISTAMSRASKPPRWSDPAAQQIVLASLLPALAVTASIGTAATASVQAGRWLEPSDSKQLRWRTISAGHPITDAVNLATGHARGLMAQLPPARPPRSPYPSPYEVLTPQLHHTGRTRPPDPTVPAPTL
jgi:hypothetical protein